VLENSPEAALVVATPGPEEANGLGSPFAHLFREINRRVTYALRILEASNRSEFTGFCKYWIIKDKKFRSYLIVMSDR
jgi:hypothetical protein